MYRIIRFYKDHQSKVIKRVQTLEDAQRHCKDPETSSKTCVGDASVEHTAKLGEWFDGYEKETLKNAI
tara:strand:- start:1013 stop:1216 length:204 start_codon:yes stop_codon:yes gene_type:complete